MKLNPEGHTQGHTVIDISHFLLSAALFTKKKTLRITLKKIHVVYSIQNFILQTLPVTLAT